MLDVRPCQEEVDKGMRESVRDLGLATDWAGSEALALVFLNLEM